MLRPLSFSKLLVFLFVHLIGKGASAQVYSSSKSAATGGTGRAAVEMGDATYLNPAILVHLRGHHFFTSASKEDLAVVLGDNSEDSAFPSSLGYYQKKSTVSSQELEQQDVTFSLAEFVADQWAFGLTGHYLQQKLPQASYRQSNADLGLLYTPVANIGLAAVLYNVFGENKDIPASFRATSSAAIGFNYIYQATVRFRIDATSQSTYMAGLENYVNRFLITRIGYQTDVNRRRDILTGGLGFNGPRFVLNYAYQGNPQISGDYRQSVDLEIPF